MNFGTAPPVCGAALPKQSIPQRFWSVLSQSDKNEFLRLRTKFDQDKRSIARDRRAVTFANELFTVLEYIDRSPDNMEARAVVAGVCFVGPIICVNTRQLKYLLCRCKSSINGILQELGYVGVRPKSKTRSCVLASMPSLERSAEILRQWSIRHASVDAKFCFLSRFPRPPMPLIMQDDLQHEDPRYAREIDAPAVSVPMIFRVESLLSHPAPHKTHSNVSTIVFGSLE
jgi:hypothetical protein